MSSVRPSLQDGLLGLAYFVTASTALDLTRYDGGVAFLWVATAMLISVLLMRPRREWGGALSCCAVASTLATGLFGLGWPLALPFAVVNMVEAVAAAWLFRRYQNSRTPFGSVPWITQFVLCVGVVGPLASALLAAGAVSFTGRDFLVTFEAFFAGHALGNITFVPLLTLVVSGTLRQSMQVGEQGKAIETSGLLLLVVAVTAGTFSQQALPLLFLPMLPVVLLVFRAGQGAAALAIVIVALVGGGLTLAGSGPVQLIKTDLGGKMQFFQFYLAALVLTVLPVAADLRNRARLHRELRASEARYRLLADHSSDIIMHLEPDGAIRFVSPSIRKLGGYDPASLIGTNAGLMIAPAHREKVAFHHRLAMAAAGETLTFDYQALVHAGEPRWFETHTRAIVDEQGRVDGLVSVIRDISARKAQEEHLQRVASTDSLTGLANRRAFRAAAQALIDRDRPACIALLDIDHFKQVNDRFGHESGDEVLRSFAMIAQRIVRRHDLVGRLGGEEFGVLLPGASKTEAIEICERIRAEVGRSVCTTDAGPVRVTVSGGVALLGPPGLDAALKQADAALYSAKSSGRDRMLAA